ncbi:MAG: Mrp/NBP35 family ATP-binding protein [Chloroflexota bacterium]
MLTVDRVREAIKDVADPELQRSLLELGMVKDITVAGGIVDVTLALTTLGCPMKKKMADDIRRALGELPEVREVRVHTAELSPEEKERIFGSRRPACAANPGSDIGQVVAVMSGKGGVGKSAVSALLAVALARQGFRVGVLDGDITGPSIPKMFGLHEKPTGDAQGIDPVISRTGIKVMSMNLLLPREEDAVIWRGPVLSNAIRQLWQQVRWGKLDYLIVDLPPGTADVPLTVMQSLPVSGVVLVSSPQELVSMVVRKAVQLTSATNVPIIGVVENMSYFECPDTHRRFEVFGPSRADEVSAAAGRPVLGRLPLDPELARLSDQGLIEDYYSEAYSALVNNFLETSREATFARK